MHVVLGMQSQSYARAICTTQAPTNAENMNALAQCQSGAMLLYLADKYDALVKTPEDRARCAQWVLFANTDLVRPRACCSPCQVQHRARTAASVFASQASQVERSAWCVG